MTDHTPESGDISKKDVAQSIGWLDAMNSDIGLGFDSADWSKVDETGVVVLEGRMAGLLVDVTVQITRIYARPDDGDLSWLDDEEA